MKTAITGILVTLVLAILFGSTEVSARDQVIASSIDDQGRLSLVRGVSKSSDGEISIGGYDDERFLKAKGMMAMGASNLFNRKAGGGRTTVTTEAKGMKMKMGKSKKMKMGKSGKMGRRFATPNPTPAPTPAPTPEPTPESTTGDGSVTVEGQLAFGFFNFNDTSVSDDDLDGILDQTELFYTDLFFAEDFGDNPIFWFLELTVTDLTFDEDAPAYIYTIEFEMTVNFFIDVPEEEEIIQAMLDANYNEFIIFYAWVAEPFGTSVFFDTNLVTFSEV